MGLVCAYEAATPLDAAVVSGVLEQAGISTRIFGASLSGGIGELPAQGLVRVMVENERLAEAREIVGQWQQQTPDETALAIAAAEQGAQADSDPESPLQSGQASPADPSDPAAHWPEWAFFVLGMMVGALIMRLFSGAP